MTIRKLGPHARQAILCGLACFVLLELGLAVAIDGWLPQFRDPFYGIKASGLRRHIEEKKCGPNAGEAGDVAAKPPWTVVMLGNSRTGHGLVARQLEIDLERELGRRVVVFNFGLPAAGPMVELLSLRRLLAEGLRPDLLLVEVWAPFLTGPPVAETAFVTIDRLGNSDLPALEQCHWPVAGLRKSWQRTWWVPSWSHRFAILSMIVPTFVPGHLRQDWCRLADETGWVPNDVTVPPAQHGDLIARVQAEWQQLLEHFDPETPSCQALRQILETCRRERIPAALVLLPEGSEFRSLYRPEIWNEIQAFLHDLSAEHAVPVFDTRSWVVDEDFSDAYHLLVRGAMSFTERLGREVVLPLLREQDPK